MGGPFPDFLRIDYLVSSSSPFWIYINIIPKSYFLRWTNWLFCRVSTIQLFTVSWVLRLSIMSEGEINICLLVHSGLFTPFEGYIFYFWFGLIIFFFRETSFVSYTSLFFCFQFWLFMSLSIWRRCFVHVLRYVYYNILFVLKNLNLYYSLYL